MSGVEWRQRAACRASDPEVFFPLPGDLAGIAQAKAICAGCPVRGECLGAALAGGDDEGVFGGYTPAERRVVRRRQAARVGEVAA